MSKRFTILIEDDWEIAGNGIGNVASHQYLPSLFLMKLARRLDIKLTFMVEVAQQLTFEKYSLHDPNLRLQKNLWIDCVKLMQEYGFDVQLHLHPQWYEARFQGDLFYLSNNWNIGKYPPSVQHELINKAIGYLTKILKENDESYRVIAFKAGSWGMQPSRHLFQALASCGIKVVMGVRHGMNHPANGVCYRYLEETKRPYYPDMDDVRKVSSSVEELFVIPLQPYEPAPAALMHLFLDRVKQSWMPRVASDKLYTSKITPEIRNLSPLLQSKKQLRFQIPPYQTHLRIGNQPYPYLKASFDSTIQSLESYDTDECPIVIECHTKQMTNHFKDVEKFLTYLAQKPNLIFKDIRSFYRDVNKDKIQRKCQRGG